MPKRLMDTKIWDQAWFLDMSMKNKAIWQFIHLNCDYAGIWEVDVVDLKRKVKAGRIDLFRFVEEANRDYNHLTGERIEVKRVMLLKENTKLWLTGFVSEQNEKGRSGLNSNVPAVKGIFSRLKEEGIMELAIREGYIRIAESDTVNKGSEGLERVTLNNNNYSLFNKGEESVKGGENVERSKTLQLYQDIWGIPPEDPEQERLTECMLAEYGEEEVEFAFRTASKYQKKNPAYVEAICRKRKQKRAAEKEIEEARKKKFVLEKQELEYKKSGTGLGLLKQVYGENYKSGMG